MFKVNNKDNKMTAINLTSVNEFRLCWMKLYGTDNIYTKTWYTAHLDTVHLCRLNHTMNLNNRINGSYEQSLTIVHDDFGSSFSNLLQNDAQVTMNKCILQVLNFFSQK